MDADVFVEAVLTELGRRTAFADVTMTTEGSDEIAARASTAYALFGRQPRTGPGTSGQDGSRHTRTRSAISQ